jgi:hypothetical protein
MQKSHTSVRYSYAEYWKVKELREIVRGLFGVSCKVDKHYCYVDFPSYGRQITKGWMVRIPIDPADFEALMFDIRDVLPE